ncbi:MAG: PTS sugar transporter subunit IIC [Gemmatimonadetes bacterium]|nr:PTS sugar transporter subunit IIC [Gemmatimonadota bacterium]
MNAPQVMGLLAVGTAAGFDLVSGPQVLLARPIVVGTLAGLILGDLPAGILVGGAMELFALEVLPVGAIRYPDHGPGTVGAVWLCHQTGAVGAGYAVLLALLCSELGGWSLQWLRRANGRALARVSERLDRGDPSAASRLQVGGATRDLGRSFLLTSVGLGAAGLAWRSGVVEPALAGMLWGVMLAAGAAGAIAGAIRMSGRSWRGALLVLALAAGWLAASVAPTLPLWEGR